MPNFREKLNESKEKTAQKSDTRMKVVNAYRNSLSATLELARLLKIDCCPSCGRRKEK